MSKRKTFPGITGNICPLLGWKTSSWALTDHSKLSRSLLQNNVSMLAGWGWGLVGLLVSINQTGSRGWKQSDQFVRVHLNSEGSRQSRRRWFWPNTVRLHPHEKYVEWYGEKCRMEWIGTQHWMPKFICFFILKVYPISFTISPGTRRWNTLVTQAASNSPSRCVYGKWDAQ